MKTKQLLATKHRILLQDLRHSLRADLLNEAHYSQEEANTATKYLFEHYLKIPKHLLIINDEIQLSAEQAQALIGAIKGLAQQEPIQYVLGEADFLGRRFRVNPQVLIPRPETEELVVQIIQENHFSQPKILDIGTGSGCIAISLALDLAKSEVFALDIAKPALNIAQANAEALAAKVDFRQLDILSESPQIDGLTHIVSNPPYVRLQEKSLMAARVWQYEPETALFVPDQDPLLFYRRIINLAPKLLQTTGKLYFEINEALSQGVEMLLQNAGFEQIKPQKDLQGKDRFVSAVWNR